MREPCALAFDNMGPIAKSHLTRRITVLEPAKLHDVRRALGTAVDCN